MTGDDDALLPMVGRRGLMLVLSSPSGAGKTTLARALLASDPNLSLSVSVTTRQPRPGERDGVDYHFIDDARFHALAESGELLEHALVYGKRYGTPRAPVQAALAEGRDVLFDIDWQGAQQLRTSAQADVVSVFILPPDAAELERRLEDRAGGSSDDIERRLAQVADDVTRWPEYDYVVINERLERSLGQLRSVVTAERLRGTRQPGLFRFAERFRR
ncbi:MAG: guanylate kinase [Alphaproteobacteria bacterium]|jgi:guanylate kinase|nr:guanylate kinase [Alphaproteobacteria bacterium]